MNTSKQESTALKSPQPSADPLSTSVKPSEEVLTLVELIRLSDSSYQSPLLSELVAQVDELSQHPDFISIHLFASTDKEVLLLFIQWRQAGQLLTHYTQSRLRIILEKRHGWIKQREANTYRTISSQANYGTEVVLSPAQSFVTMLDVVEYWGSTYSKRKASLEFNLRNGHKFIAHPDCYGIAVLQNEDITRALTIGQWKSEEAFLAVVRNTAPLPVKWLLGFVKSVSQLNRLLQFLGKWLQSRPEYHAYHLVYDANRK